MIDGAVLAASAVVVACVVGTVVVLVEDIRAERRAREEYRRTRL